MNIDVMASAAFREAPRLVPRFVRAAGERDPVTRGS
jgi:hypothetical protein